MVNGFSWVIEGEIAAWRDRRVRGLWAWLAERRGLVVSLTSSPPDPGVLASRIELLHLPVADFAAVARSDR